METSPDAAMGSVWIGTLENAQLADGSNQLRMTLAVDPSGVATGTVLLGDGALLQPPTDPNVGYPLGVDFNYAGPLGFFEGFPYTIDGGVMTGDHLTFQIAEFEIWTQWCALQTMTYPLPAAAAPGSNGYECAPSSNPFTGPDGGGVTIDQAKWFLCDEEQPCICMATGCQVKTPSPLNVAFDLTITGSTADGSISGGLGDHTVHFTRDAVMSP